MNWVQELVRVERLCEYATGSCLKFIKGTASGSWVFWEVYSAFQENFCGFTGTVNCVTHIGIWGKCLALPGHPNLVPLAMWFLLSLNSSRGLSRWFKMEGCCFLSSTGHFYMIACVLMWGKCMYGIWKWFQLFNIYFKWKDNFGTCPDFKINQLKYLLPRHAFSLNVLIDWFPTTISVIFLTGECGKGKCCFCCSSSTIQLLIRPLEWKEHWFSVIAWFHITAFDNVFEFFKSSKERVLNNGCVRW